MDQPNDWALCRKHWPTVPRKIKTAIRRAWKRYEVAHAKGIVDGNAVTFMGRRLYLDQVRAGRAYDRLCRLAVRKAIEAELGIG